MNDTAMFIAILKRKPHNPSQINLRKILTGQDTLSAIIYKQLDNVLVVVTKELAKRCRWKTKKTPRHLADTSAGFSYYHSATTFIFPSSPRSSPLPPKYAPDLPTPRHIAPHHITPLDGGIRNLTSDMDAKHSVMRG